MGNHRPGGLDADEFEETVVCSKCGFENAARFFGCLNCGHILKEADVVVCSKCGFESTTEFLECLNCRHTLKEADIPEDNGGAFVKLFSTCDRNFAVYVLEQLEAAGVECYSVEDSTLAEKRAPLTLSRMRDLGPSISPATVEVPAEQASRAEAVLAQIRRAAGDLPITRGASPQSDEPVCPACETPYRPADYDPQALHIYCTACGAELPRR